MTEKRRATFIYFVSPVGGGPIKVGSTTNPQARLTGLSGWSFLDLELVALAEGERVVEKAIREQCHGYVIRGEWYEPCAPLLEIIEHVKATNSLPENILRRAGELSAKHAAERQAWLSAPRKSRCEMSLTNRPMSAETLAVRRAKRSQWLQQKREAESKSRTLSFHIATNPTSSAAE